MDKKNNIDKLEIFPEPYRKEILQDIDLDEENDFLFDEEGDLDDLDFLDDALIDNIEDAVLEINERNFELFLDNPLSEEAAETLYSLGLNYYQSGKFTDASVIFRLLTLTNGSTANYWLALGACSQKLEAYEDAQIQYSLAGALDANNPVPILHRAECCFAINDIENGLEDLDFCEEIAEEVGNKEILNQVSALRQAWKPQTKKNKNNDKIKKS